MSRPAIINCGVEGIVDEAVVRRLITHAGAVAGEVYGKQGKAHLRRRIEGYTKAAQRAPWFVLVDLDRDEVCAAALRKDACRPGYCAFELRYEKWRRGCSRMQSVWPASWA